MQLGVLGDSLEALEPSEVLLNRPWIENRKQEPYNSGYEYAEADIHSQRSGEKQV